jgi:hypothetical protein
VRSKLQLTSFLANGNLLSLSLPPLKSFQQITSLKQPHLR